MPQFDMETAVRRLVSLAANKQEHRPQSTEGESVGRFVLARLADYPEPSSAWTAADKALKAFADELAAIGGVDLMVETYDAVIDRFGYRAVMGVSASWHGCHGWWH